MAVKQIRVNGQMINARVGESILQAAQDAGIHIPRLCHLEGVSDIAACRLCLVELETPRGPHLVAACATTIEDGMRVTTNSEKLNQYRRMIVELLFAEGNHVCAVCVVNGNCELQNLAIEVGMDHSRFEYRFPVREVDLTHKMFGKDENRCIFCTRCVRVCDEIEGAHVWDLGGRGNNLSIVSGLNQDWGTVDACTKCGKCVEACPTGSLFFKGSAVSEMERDAAKLDFLVQAREKQEWTR